MKYVLDASVFVARHSPKEKHHESAKALWELVRPTKVYAPEIFPLEVVAAFSRLQFDADAIAEHHSFVTSDKFILHPMDKSLLDEAVIVAKDGRVRAADAIYMALAIRFEATFVTLDFKLQRYLSTSPNAFLRRLKILSYG